MLELSDKWTKILLSQPETGMDYQVVSVFLRDGRRIDNVTVVGSKLIGEVNGGAEMPFKEDEIIDIKVMSTLKPH
jgi:hypothetical protein